jgi:SAM-dependent methyltransferase
VSESAPRAAWDAFWSEQQVGRSTQRGCLPRGHGLDTILSAAWRRYAATLPRGARVIDVATGDGRVMGWMLSERRDLQLEGVDLAAHLPASPSGTIMRGGIAMEQLPYANGEFTAAVSQFGFEYGDMVRAADELARVLAPHGSIALVTHRNDGPILAQNLRRGREIEWAILERKLPSVAREAIGLLPGEPLPDELAQGPTLGRERFGPRSAAWEIAEALRMTVALGRDDDPAKVAELVGRIETKARSEMDRIAALAAACGRIADGNAIAQALASAGLAQREAHAMYHGPGAAPFADFRLIGPA